MKTIAILVACGLGIVCASCGRKAQESKDEKIRIVVERPETESDKRDKPIHEQQEKQRLPASQTNIAVQASEAQGPANEERNLLMDIAEIQKIVIPMVRSDEKIRGLTQNGNTLALAQYLSVEHKKELTEIMSVAKMQDEKKAAFLISHGIITRNKTKHNRPFRGDRRPSDDVR